MARTTIRSEDITASEVTTAKMAVDPTNASNLSSGSVPLAQLGNVDTSGITANKDDIALLAFKTQANGSLARYNLVDQSVDSFEDASGIDASASTNDDRNSSGKYYTGLGPVTATGGTTTTDGDYTIHSITATGSTNYVTDTAQTIDYLIIGGGGGGGYQGGGGGGAGGYRYFTGQSLAAGTFAAVVGTGGSGGTNNTTSGTSGGNSSFNGSTSAGGGGGGSLDQTGGSGGSGGGGNRHSNGGSGNTPSTSPVQGYPGGDGAGTDTRGGGGGGASATGAASTVGNGGVGGDGLSNSITGSAVYYAGGGGGGSDNANKAGGQGGGGAGGTEAPGGPGPVQGTDGLGGGGGGSRPYPGQSPSSGAVGGSGIVIIRRPTLGAEGGDMTLISNAQTAQSAPTNGDLVMTISNGAGTTTVNTDIKAYISRDGSAYTSAVTLASQGTTGGHTILTANGVDLSGIATGTSMRWKVTTHNQSASKTTRIHAVSLGWS